MAVVLWPRPGHAIEQDQPAGQEATRLPSVVVISPLPPRVAAYWRRGVVIVRMTALCRSKQESREGKADPYNMEKTGPISVDLFRECPARQCPVFFSSPAEKSPEHHDS